MTDAGTIRITARTLDLAREALGHDGENALQSLPCGVESDGPAGACNTKSGPNRNGSYEDHVMAAKALPSPEVLRQLLRYEPDTGKLFWRERCEDRGTHVTQGVRELFGGKRL